MRDMSRGFTEDDGFDDRVHVEPVRKRLTDPLVREARCLRTRRVPRDERVPELRELADLDGVDRLHVGEVLRVERTERQLAGLETVRDRGGVRDDLVDVLIDVGGAL